MALCASCGLMLSGSSQLCPHHHCVYGDDWAVANRIMCDFFHRGKVPPRLTQYDREDFWAWEARDERQEPAEQQVEVRPRRRLPPIVRGRR